MQAAVWCLTINSPEALPTMVGVVESSTYDRDPGGNSLISIPYLCRSHLLPLPSAGLAPRSAHTILPTNAAHFSPALALQLCCAVRAEWRCGPLDAGAEDGLDGFENVFYFIAVCIPVDFLSLTDHPGALPLLQALPYKVAASEEGCFGGGSPKVHSEPHPGDNEAVISPSIGITDRLGHQDVLSISPPDENIVQQLPAALSMVHPRDLLPHRKAEEGVGQQETVFRTRSQKKDAGIVTATETMGTQHSLPDSVVRPDAGV
ncbi:unnamed protein product [Schistocephalus solidus]|uniref:Uncharacterized protein n=1 Tax=Schistocephalus solidus TaxID=70667 RepID=A0A183TDL2_SCHSO|nr:unnamed protein product [Schistocephalus solidus]